MRSQHEIESQWICPEGIPGVDYRFGDVVRVKNPDLNGEHFEVISLLALTPQPVFGVTRLTDEEFLTVSQEDLESVGRNTGRVLEIKKLGEKL